MILCRYIINYIYINFFFDVKNIINILLFLNFMLKLIMFFVSFFKLRFCEGSLN